MGALELALRFGAAALVGAALGLNRDLHRKSTRMRALGLVGFGSALAVLAFGQASSAHASPVIQGILSEVVSSQVYCNAAANLCNDFAFLVAINTPHQKHIR